MREQWLRGVRRDAGRPVAANLRRLWGVGHREAEALCRRLALRPSRPYGRLSAAQRRRLQGALGAREGVGEPGRRRQRQWLRAKATAGCAAAVRRKAGLPARGQRTRSNGKSARRLNPGRRATG